MGVELGAKWISNLFKNKGLENLARWVDFALTTEMPDMWKDFTDIISAMRIDISWLTVA